MYRRARQNCPPTQSSTRPIYVTLFDTSTVDLNQQNHHGLRDDHGGVRWPLQPSRPGAL